MTTIWVDGGCSGNGTDDSHGYGSFLIEGEAQPHRLDFGSGTTNNICEYKAMIAALKYCAENNIKKPSVISDSQLVVMHLRGAWKVRHAHLRPLYQEAGALVYETGARLEWRHREELVSVLGH